MTQIKDLSTVAALRSLSIHLGVLFFVIFPVGILALVITKFLIWLLFAGFNGDMFTAEIYWIYNANVDTDALLMLESSVLMNCTASFIALVVFMIRALLKMGELPSSTAGIVTLHVHLGSRMVALPLLTVLTCTVTSLAMYIAFDIVDSFIDAYFWLAMIVLLPAAIGTWIWVWRGAWITSIEENSLLPPKETYAEKVT